MRQALSSEHVSPPSSAREVLDKVGDEGWERAQAPELQEFRSWRVPFAASTRMNSLAPPRRSLRYQKRVFPGSHFGVTLVRYTRPFTLALSWKARFQ